MGKKKIKFDPKTLYEGYVLSYKFLGIKFQRIWIQQGKNNLTNKCFKRYEENVEEYFLYLVRYIYLARGDDKLNPSWKHED
jgi:hypothetical protein